MSEKDPNEPASEETEAASRSVTLSEDAGDADEAGRGSRVPLVVAAVALVVALAVAGGGAWGGWWLYQRLQAVSASAEGFVTDGELDERTGPLSQRLQRLDARLANLNEQVGGRGDAIAELRSRLDGIGEDQQALAERMGRVEEMARTNKDDWQRSEAAYLATVAVHRLRYYRDVDAALQALKEADELLSDFGGREIEARKGVARAIDRLIEVEPPRVDHILGQLEQLRGRIDDLPVDTGPDPLITETGGGSDAPAQMTGEGWRDRLDNAWGQFTGSLGQLVTISSERKVAPLRTPEERFFLTQNLKLQIEAARMAVLRGEQPAFDRSIQRLDDWLGTYFDPDADAVSSLRGDLDTLADARVRVTLPDIAPLLAPVRAFE